MTLSSYVVGLDLGRKHDYTALAVLRQTPTSTVEARYDLVHLARWTDRSYRHVVPEVARVRQQIRQTASREVLDHYGAVPGGWPGPEMPLVVDQTGVGLAVVDDLRANGLDCVGITIHGGDAVSRDGNDYRVPKRELVGIVQVLLQSRRLGIPRPSPDPDVPRMPYVDTLVAELDNFRAKITLATGHDTYGAGEEWRAGAHDDLVIAVAMAAWYGERQSRGLADLYETAAAIGTLFQGV